ncbi:MAG TPA: helical backbone metal receptor [Longimicrobiales bacterium]|nr:helical backbone metal receptor [Longimicrobiales bacterium]
MRRSPRGRLRPGRVPLLSALLIAAAFASACSPRSDQETAREPASASAAVRVVDASGATVELEAPARRIVSLVPSATATLHAIGAEGALAGRTDYDVELWAAHVPSVGGGLEPSVEKIVALEPDLVVYFLGAQDTRTPARLDRLGIPHLAVRPDRIEDIYETAVLLGEVTGRREAADSLVASIREGLAHVAETVAHLPSVRVAYVLGGEPPWVAGPGTYIDEVLSLAGGDNAFADLDALYAPVSAEQLRSRRIDVVLLAEGSGFDRSLTPSARVETVGPLLDTPGPGVVRAATRVAALLHGRAAR